MIFLTKFSEQKITCIIIFSWIFSSQIHNFLMVSFCDWLLSIVHRHSIYIIFHSPLCFRWYFPNLMHGSWINLAFVRIRVILMISFKHKYFQESIMKPSIVSIFSLSKHEILPKLYKEPHSMQKLWLLWQKNLCSQNSDFFFPLTYWPVFLTYW